MKRRLFLTMMLALLATMMMAVPAKRGVWKTLTLADGREVQAQLVGDERAHAWRTEAGVLLQKDKGSMRYAPVKRVALKQTAMKRMTGSHARRIARQQTGKFVGSKRGLVILVNFSDVKFQTAHNNALYQNIMNKENYTNSTYGFQGSVRDYFKAQSEGVFDLQFDVVGPVTLSKKQAYYGGNDSEGNDSCVAVMAAEACKLVDKDVDFSKYDWSGDGEVDQVYVVYAGKGEADSGVENTVWPHEWTLSEGAESGDGDGPLTLDGVKIDTYACGSEVDAYNDIEGIGTFCHEFSHCLGYPDMYDTDYAGYFGMGDFDLMCGGSYNGDGFVPAGYTAWEKWTAGWLEPIELNDEDLQVDNLKAISDGGGAYIIYNQGHRDEYFLIENRQKTGWDAQLPARGIMITHVDYDAVKFAFNIVNTIYPEKEAYQDAYDYYSPYVDMGYITESECEILCQEYVDEYANDNERMAIVHADNDDDRSYWNENRGTYSKTTVTTDLFPYQSNDSLTNNSRPAATLYHPNTDGNKYLNHGIFDMRQNSDGTVSFRYQAIVASKGGGHSGDYLFYESFDDCDGKGGNDGLWNGSIASASFSPDNDGWESEKAFGADECAKFGTSSIAGVVTSPSIALNGEATLTFMAGAWDAKNDKTTLNISVDGGSIEPATFTMEKGAWTNFTATITGTGNVTLTFSSEGGRFFLDEVGVKVKADGIDELRVPNNESQPTIYDLCGRKVVQPSKKGLYIKNGRIIVIR